MGADHKLPKGLRLKNGIYHANFKLKKQPRVWFSTEVKYDGKRSTEQKALDIRENQRQLALDGKYFKKASPVLLKDLLVRELDQSTMQGGYATKRSSVEILKAFFKEKRAIDITEDDVQAFIYSRRADGIKDNSTHRDLCTLRKVYNDAIGNPMFNFVFNPVKKPMKLLTSELPNFRRDRIATDEEVSALWNSLSPITRRVIMFEASSGLRWGEVRNLRWPDILWEHCIAKIKKNKERNPFKTVPLHRDAMQILKLFPRIGEWIFCMEDGSKLKEHGLIRSEFKRVKKALNIENLRMHDLRHTFTTHLAEDSGDIIGTSKIVGHADPKITSEVYTHLTSDHLVKVVNKKRSLLDMVNIQNPGAKYVPAKVQVPTCSLN